MSFRIPRFPKKPTQPRIDHANFASENVDRLRRRIGYPSTSNKRKGSERLKAIQSVLHTRVRNEETMVVFVYCVSQDMMTSRNMRDIANKAIQRSKYLIRKKMRSLQSFHRRSKRKFDKLHDRMLQRELNGITTRIKVIQELNEYINGYKSTLQSKMDFLLEWDNVKYGPEVFRKVLVKELNRFSPSTLIGRGLGPLSSNMKRKVTKNAISSPLYALPSSNNNINNLFNTNSNGSSGSNSNHNRGSRSRSNGRRRS